MRTYKKYISGFMQEILASKRRASFTCAIQVSTNAAFCWGKADDGKLGNGVETGTFSTPIAVNGSNVFETLSAGANTHHVIGLLLP